MEARALEAHSRGLGSIAFAQALQTGLMVRQKDAIGEWIPLTDPGTSEVIVRDVKWVAGFRWEKVDAQFRLEHRLSKSIR